jgi:uncharacterized protein YoxC
MEYLPIVYVIILSILTIVLAVVGVQMFLVLNELKKTLQKVNTTLDTVEDTVTAVTQPLQGLGGIATGLSTGMKVFETFTGWLNRDKDQTKG